MVASRKFKIGDVLITRANNPKYNVIFMIKNIKDDYYILKVLSNPASLNIKDKYECHIIDLSCELTTLAERILYGL